MSFLLNILNETSGGGCSSGACSSGGCGSHDQSHGSGGCGCGSPAPSHGPMSAQAEATRREFLSRATSVTIGGLSLTVLPVAQAVADKLGSNVDELTLENAASAAAAVGEESGVGRSDVLYGFIVDTEKCIGAGKCLTACRVENNVPEGYARTWVERFVHFKDGRVQVDLVPETGFEGSEIAAINPDDVDRAYFVPKLCNHCEDAPCNQVCPVHASITSPEGVELVDPDRCIGCAYCVQACPYGVRFINPDTGNADKCTWCYHRITKDEKPACVEACPVGARIFGRLDDPNSEISKRLKEIPTHVLKEHLGTHPKLFYVGLSGEVV
ncbi:MAG: 4Fe-4S dicluster domain-containing protein [Planctomycetaceae bacterium]|nr:4Fe-4S dicluster domain-containing protein [Planctomycetaceae bacterium]